MLRQQPIRLHQPRSAKPSRHHGKYDGNEHTQSRRTHSRSLQVWIGVDEDSGRPHCCIAVFASTAATAASSAALTLIHRRVVILSAEQAKHVGDEENQQYCPQSNAGPAARTPAGMAVV